MPKVFLGIWLGVWDCVAVVGMVLSWATCMVPLSYTAPRRPMDGDVGARAPVPGNGAGSRGGPDGFLVEVVRGTFEAGLELFRALPCDRGGSASCRPFDLVVRRCRWIIFEGNAFMFGAFLGWPGSWMPGALIAGSPRRLGR